MTKYSFNNDSTPAERRAVLRNERATTYHAFATGQADPVHDRFEEINRSSVTGATPAQRYPALPEGAWSNQTAAMPPEPSLGYSVEWAEPLGTAAEIARSLDGSTDCGGVKAMSPSDDLPSGDELRGGRGSLHPRVPHARRRRRNAKGT